MSKYVYETDITISPLASYLSRHIINHCEIEDDADVLCQYLNFDKPVLDGTGVKVWVQHLMKNYPQLFTQDMCWVKDCVLYLFGSVAPWIYLTFIHQDFDFGRLWELTGQVQDTVITTI